MKLQKLSANLFALANQIDDSNITVTISATDGKTVADILIDHKERSIKIVLNVEALKYNASISKIADMLCVPAVFLKNDNIKVKNLYGYEVTVQHKEM